jgi:hypothetical protein
MKSKDKFSYEFSFERFKALPFYERYEHKWYVPFPIYKEPFALEWQEWDKFYAYIKEEHPVQFFFRRTLNVYLGGWEHRFSNFYYKIKNKISNPRKEMRAAVFPPEYRDLDSIIENFHFQVILEFVDREKCFDTNAYLGKGDKKFKKELLAHYNYITKDREACISESYIRKRDEKLAIWVIKNRNKLWT